MREMEQEVASAANFINEAVGEDVSPYYWEIPASFLVPAVYYPSPSIDSAGDALDTYRTSYMWLIKFFHKSDAEAQNLARAALFAIKGAHNCIPLKNEDGSDVGKCFRVRDPSIKQVERGAWQLELRWDSPRFYPKSDVLKAMKFRFSVNNRGDIIPSKEYLEHDVSSTVKISRANYEYTPSGTLPEMEVKSD